MFDPYNYKVLIRHVYFPYKTRDGSGHLFFNFKRDRLFPKINLFYDIFKPNLRILVKFAESPGIFNEQVVCMQGSGVGK